ncbi:hypothetical protein ABEB36_005453 [Hypothenemus hampei]|uniref:Uncharacterized protein n=1 Tax=Hypothenemus hampei TaxID=57062 RepID=A0ABD1EY97_HYPHA
MENVEEKLWALQQKLKETDANLSACMLLLRQYLREQEAQCAKTTQSTSLLSIIAFLAVIAMALAFPGGHGGEDYATPIIHGHPVVTHVFETPGLGYFHNYAPKIDGHLVVRGIGPHIIHKEHH